MWPWWSGVVMSAPLRCWYGLAWCLPETVRCRTLNSMFPDSSAAPLTSLTVVSSVFYVTYRTSPSLWAVLLELPQPLTCVHQVFIYLFHIDDRWQSWWFGILTLNFKKSNLKWQIYIKIWEKKNIFYTNPFQ